METPDNFNIKLNVCAFKHVIRKMKNKAGEMVECLIMPLEANHAFPGEKGRYIDITAIAVKNPKFDDTHILKQSLPKEVYEKMNDDEKKSTPIFGNMGPWKGGKSEAGAVVDNGAEDDDLPF